MLWIALHLPALPLESFLAGLPEAARGEPVALFDAPGRAVDAANAQAQALGVKPGLRRATALALAPRLIHQRRGAADAAREAQALMAVAHVALSFTPAVTLPDAPPGLLDGGGAGYPALPGAPATPRSSPPSWLDGAGAGHTVLFDVQASLRRFGGPGRSLPRLLGLLRDALAPLGHVVRSASAPTALGAALLARCGAGGSVMHQTAGRPDRPASTAATAALAPGHCCFEHLVDCADRATLLRRLHKVPAALLDSASQHRDVLRGMGLHTLGDLLRLPRGGLARRFGEALPDELDRALGRRPDPRGWVELPAVFEARLELFARADTAEQVLYGAGVLLAQLVGWLRARQVRVRRFALQMQHERHRRQADCPEASTLEIALAEPSCDAAHLRVLLHERLAHVRLAAPTLELRLHCADVARGGPPNSELFASAGSEREGLMRLVERLQARLGHDRVQRLQPVADHRPERAAAVCPADALQAGRVVVPSPQAAKKPVQRPQKPAVADEPAGKPAASKPARKPLASRAAWPLASNHHVPTPRPVWLLREPQALPECGSRPSLDGCPLQLLCGPERIEAGWWDAAAGLAQRDYFIAQAGDGALVWVYRARLPLLVPEVEPSAEEGPPAELHEQSQGWFLQGRFA